MLAYDSMKTVCNLLGQPDDHLLDARRNTKQFFTKEYCAPGYSTWRLKTPREFTNVTGVRPSTAGYVS